MECLANLYGVTVALIYYPFQDFILKSSHHFFSKKTQVHLICNLFLRPIYFLKSAFTIITIKLHNNNINTLSHGATVMLQTTTVMMYTNGC